MLEFLFGKNNKEVELGKVEQLHKEVAESSQGVDDTLGFLFDAVDNLESEKQVLLELKDEYDAVVEEVQNASKAVDVKVTKIDNVINNFKKILGE